MRSLLVRLPLLLLVTLLLATLSSRPASAWGLHYLVTDRAMSHEAMAFTAEKVRVEPLEVFLKKQGSELRTLFQEFNGWMVKNDLKHARPSAFDPEHADRAAFLAAARLNPDTSFPLVRRLLPGEPQVGREVTMTSFSPNEVMKPPFLFRFVTALTDEEISGRAVLSTFADEPDWKMDEALFSGHPELGYGPQPYGDPKGTASRAPFHMLFHHENLVVKTFAHEITEGLTPDRVELFSRLAKLAFRTGHRYWGYRFTAWALHYVEDLGQPYHSKAVPSAGWGYYLNFAASSEKARIKQETTQLVKNRHFAYEDFVAFSLQQSYLEKRELFEKLSGFLSAGTADFSDVHDPLSLLGRVSDFAAAHAPAIDRAIIEAYGPHYTEDPTYDLESDIAYHVQEVIAHLSPKAASDILEETGKDFASTGRAARTLVLTLCKP